MAKYSVVFETKEVILGVFPKSREWVKYSGKLVVKDGGKKPVTLSMVFVPPHPFAFGMPEEHIIKAESMTDAYVKVVRFFGKYGIEYGN